MSTTIADKLSTRILNSGTDPQRSDRFNVRFLGIPENLSDFLSRQVRNFTPPAVTFQTMQHANRRANFQDVGKVESEILTINFLSDGEGILDAIIMSQIFRQKGVEISGFEGTKGNAKFDVLVEFFNAKGDVIRTEKFVKCFISSVQKGDLEVEADTNIIYTMTIQYDEIDYSIEGEVFPLISS